MTRFKESTGARDNGSRPVSDLSEDSVAIPNDAPDVCYSIVVPAYNESESLPTLIEDLGWLMGELRNLRGVDRR